MSFDVEDFVRTKLGGVDRGVMIRELERADAYAEQADRAQYGRRGPGPAGSRPPTRRERIGRLLYFLRHDMLPNPVDDANRKLCALLAERLR